MGIDIGLFFVLDCSILTKVFRGLRVRITGLRDRINFAAGNVDLYSDFDGTYCPAKHSSLHDPNANGFMSEYCTKMDSFFKSTTGDVHFHLTTGRTFGEYESVSWLLKMRGFRLPLPETVITKDGSDRLIKNGNDSDFYDHGSFPFTYNGTSKDKEMRIKELTNWDGESIRNELKRLVEKYKITFIEADSQNSVFDYGERSLYSSGKLNPDEWRNLPSRDGHIIEHNTPVAEYVLGSRNDGNLKLNLIFPPDYGFCPERNWIYDNFMNDLRAYMNSNNVRYHIDWEPASEYNHHRISCSVTPEFESGALTKLFDTKEALKEAVRNNDIVVTAGDGSNDFDMLNPMRYLDNDFVRQCEETSRYKEFYRKSMPERLEDLQKVYNGDNSDYIKGLRKELTENGFLKNLEELPLYSIVVKKKNSKLQPLIDTFARIGKVIAVEAGKIDEGIKQAVKRHAEKNKGFKDAMSNSFQTLIFGAKKKSAKKHNYAQIAAAILLTGLLGVAGYKYLKNTREVQNENSTNIKSKMSEKDSR